MNRRRVAIFLLLVLVLGQSLLALGWPRSVSGRALADNGPAEDRGALALGQAIKRLGVVASVLHTGAHPDDEDSGLLAYLARGRQARTAYLSLTRGDGGQNLIGPELYEPLGVIRTEELLAARRLDGATQFFSRAFDFGFSKSRTETLSKWDRNAVLADMVRVIRTFRPMVIVSAWSGTPNDGHGHHQAAGLLTLEAFHAAADPSKYPEQIASGLRAWQAKKLYLRSGDVSQQGREAGLKLSTLSINTGEFDPLLGCSYYEIAARGRSQHRSQDQGTLELRGPRSSKLRLIENTIGPIQDEKDIFDGIDARLTGIADYAGKGKAKLTEQLAEVQSAADEAKQRYNPFDSTSVTQTIARGLSKLRNIRAALGNLGLSQPEFAETEFLLKLKESDFADALMKAGGLVVDCLAEDEVVTPGQPFTVTLTAYANAGATIAKFGLLLPPGWTAVEKGKPATSETAGRVILQADYTVTVAADAEPTRPYWLNSPRKGDMFTVDKPSSGATGIEPVAPPEIAAAVDLDIAGQRVGARQGVQHRFADRALGEIRHDLKVAPAVSLTISPDILVYPASQTALEREVTVSVTNNKKGSVRGSLAIEKPAEWQVNLATASFELKRKGERASFTVIVKAPPASSETRRSVSAVAEVDGKQYREGYQVVAYPHVEPHFIYRQAKAGAEIIDVKVAPGLKVGYIEGAGDDFANALRRLGVSVSTIDSNELASGDLSRYDTIVAGVRVYEVRPDVIANNARLLDYVQRGGTFIVQYNKSGYEEGGFTPFPIGPKEKRTREDREPRWTFVDEANLSQVLSSKPNLKVGYIGGSGGRVGSGVKLIGEGELASGDLSAFDVIVLGAHAYQTRPDVVANNRKLLDYSRRKIVIVEYDKGQYEKGDFSPYPKLDPKPYRVTDETAPVTILEPAHPRFNFPNKITNRDFEGWVQERGAYYLSEWDAQFKPLMSCRDAGEDEKQGGEVIAQYGKGLYVYTAYGWYRQLPVGVPGAYRLIANLVSLAKAPGARKAQ